MSHTPTPHAASPRSLAGALSGVLACAIFLTALGTDASGSLAAAKREQNQRRTIVPIADFAAGRTIADASTDNRIAGAMRERRSVMNASIRLSFVFPDNRRIDPWILAFKDHPQWIRVEDDGASLFSAVDVDAMMADLTRSLMRSFPPAVSCTMTATTTDKQGTLRPVWKDSACVARTGVLFHQAALKEALRDALLSGGTDVTVVFTADQPVLQDEVHHLSLSLLSVGRSNFEGSDPNRAANVRKVMSERVHNIIVPAGAIFSFNAMLGDLQTKDGWRMGLGIFEDGQLKPTLGGGICQGSTTLYRAALEAGMPLLEHKSHSLFVHYYEQYGIGQDVTIYLGSQDFSFKNDFATPIVIQAETSGSDAYVRIFAVPDSRSVTVSGPYFAQNAPADLKVNNRSVRHNEIVWLRSVTYKDGTVAADQLVSRYKYALRAVADTWIATHLPPAPLLAKY